MQIKPIRNDDDHDAALARIEALWGSAVGTTDGDELDVQATLVEAYESRRWPDREVDPIDLLKAFMEETDRAQADLAKVLGSRSRASEIINRKRALTVEMIWKITRAWSLPAEMLARPYKLATAA
ncbi:MAG: helix-turn-helix domain-containing protein [Beijerinckiaceae bacterium]